MSSETKQRILDAAERLFAEQGFESTSLRAIIAKAGVNLASIHYHFHTKEGLIRSVLERRFNSIHRERLRLLEQSQKRAGKVSPPVEEIVEAFVRPMLALGVENSEEDKTTMQLVGRIFIHPGEITERIMVDQIRELAQSFTQAFQKALPNLTLSEIVWRLNFAIGSTAKAMFGGIPMKVLSDLAGENHENLDIETIIQRLITFTAAGMRAEPSKPDMNIRRSGMSAKRKAGKKEQNDGIKREKSNQRVR